MPAGPRLGMRIEQLEKQWEVSRTSFGAGDGDSGFTQVLDEFFASFHADYPRQRVIAEQTLSAIDAARRDGVAPVVSEPRVKDCSASGSTSTASYTAAATSTRPNSGPRWSGSSPSCSAGSRHVPSRTLRRSRRIMKAGPPDD